MEQDSTHRGGDGPSDSDWHSSRHQNLQPKQTRSIPPALGSEIISKTLEQLDNTYDNTETKISDCQFVASYNLLEGLQKTIFVPGRPPTWTPPLVNQTLRSDSGEYYRDENAARFPEFPMEPAVQSIFQINPLFDAFKVNVFSCDRTLAQILRFCTEAPEPFSFTVHMVGETAFFLRRNQSPTELIENIQGFGHTFKEVFTTWAPDVKGSASHQRIISYLFGGLRFLVRFEADGYVPDDIEDIGEQKSTNLADKTEYDKSLEQTEDTSVVGTLDDEQEFKHLEGECVQDLLVVREKGDGVPQSSVFDIKTRSEWKPVDGIMKEQLPRLWARQIPNFVLGRHQRGYFKSENKVRDVTADINNWEQESSTGLHRMACLIKDIRDTAMATDGGKLEVRGGDSSSLHLHQLSAAEIGNWNALSDELHKRWAES